MQASPHTYLGACTLQTLVLANCSDGIGQDGPVTEISGEQKKEKTTGHDAP